MRHINFLIKPASSLCNLRCKYCFYEDEAVNRHSKSLGIMTPETAQRLIERAYSEIEPGGTVNFAFQGGEPTVAGLEFFRTFTANARARCPKGAAISFAIQTNGTLLDEEWAEFFHDEHYLVGLSMDGFRQLHDKYRVDNKGNGTWSGVTRALNLLKKHNVDVNALCVVTGRCARSPGQTYRELKKLGFRYIQFIACLDPIGDERGSMPYSLTPEAYGQFLCNVFDLWYADWARGQYHSVRLFDDFVHILLGNGASTCATCGTCGEYFVVEGDGSVILPP
ncbi:MAG: radical SAM protein, partial [Ruminococcus flavefaciens]|nr:radical SAM protein [Ruminococcus flavefaciens]